MNEDYQFIQLGDGTLIDPSNGKRVVSTEINKAFSDAPNSSLIGKRGKVVPKYEGGKRRFLDDLPLPPIQSRAIAIVAAYATFGLSPADIAFILQTEVETIEKVLDSEPYSRFLDAILQNIREHDLDKVRKKINDAAESAANSIVDLVHSKDEKVKLAASKDVLDRAVDGAYSSNRGSHSGNTLTIRVIDSDDQPMNVEVDVA